MLSVKKSNCVCLCVCNRPTIDRPAVSCRQLTQCYDKSFIIIRSWEMERVKNTISLVSPAFLQGRPKLSLRFGRLDFVSLLDSTFSALAFQSSKIIGIFFFFLLEDKEEYLEISDQIANFAELFPRAVCNGPGNKSALEQSASHLQLLLLLFFLLLLLYFLPASVRGIWQEEDFCGHDMETRVRDPEQQQEQQQKQNAQMWIFFRRLAHKWNQSNSSSSCFFIPMFFQCRSFMATTYIYICFHKFCQSRRNCLHFQSRQIPSFVKTA